MRPWEDQRQPFRTCNDFCVCQISPYEENKLLHSCGLRLHVKSRMFLSILFKYALCLLIDVLCFFFLFLLKVGKVVREKKLVICQHTVVPQHKVEKRNNT